MVSERGGRKIVENVDPFAEYAEIKQKLAELEERRRELELDLFDALDSTGGQYSNKYGTFKSYGRKSYKYSPRIDALKEHIKTEKKKEEQTGEATLEKVTQVLMFTSRKD